MADPRRQCRKCHQKHILDERGLIPDHKVATSNTQSGPMADCPGGGRPPRK